MLAANQFLNQGRYRIVGLFNQDESGGTYEAYDTVSSTNVVLRESLGKVGKIITPSQLESINAEFAGSAKTLKEIKHDSLVSIQDYFSEIDRQYLVLESVTGDDLTKFLEPAAAMPELRDAMSWVDQLLDALHYLHRLSPPIVHHDIKPSSIKLTSNYRVKLLTMAIPTAPSSDVVTLIPGQTSANTSFNYKPLEQLWGGLDPASQRVILNSYDEKSAGVLLRPLDARSDLYSVAASFYHVLTGVAPCDALERSIAVLEGKPDPLAKLADLKPVIPPEISEVFMRAMAIRRENRFDSAVIMRQILRTAMVRVEERLARPSDTLGIDNNPQTEIDPAQDLLEFERTRAEIRQGEIEDEQRSLAEERDRIDERQLELEEQLALQKVEQECLLLEKEAREKEAEAERGRAARLRELQAEESRHRAEQERLEADAKRASIIAEDRIDDTPTGFREPADLLDLDSTGRFSAPADPTADVPESAAFTTLPVAQFADTEDPQREHSGLNRRMVAAAALFVIAASIGVWNLMPEAEPAARVAPVQATIAVEQVDPQAQLASPVDSRELPVLDETPAAIEAQPTEITISRGNPKPPQTNPTQNKVKRPSTLAAKAPSPKKRLTVDDLLR